MNLGHWQFLTGFFKFSFVKLFISWFAIVPVVVYLLRELPDVVVVSTAPDVSISLQVGLPFSWIILWAASLLFALSATLFAIFCPSFIKRHDTYEKYKVLGHSPRWVVWEVHYALTSDKKSWFWKYENTKSMRKRFVDKGLAEEANPSDDKLSQNQNSAVFPEGDRSIVYFRHEGKVYRMYSKQAPPDGDERENDIFWELFGYLAKTHPIIRGAIKWLIIFSFFLVAIVVIENIWFAVEYITQWETDAMNITQA